MSLTFVNFDEKESVGYLIETHILPLHPLSAGEQGYILLGLTDVELHTIENITCCHIHSAVYRWREGQPFVH